MAAIPTIIVTDAGAIPTPPATLRAQLVALVAATNPDYTADLPASLIEDLASTMVAGLSIVNQSAIDTINSLTPFLANPFVLTELGQALGVPLGLASNTSVFIVVSGPASNPAGAAGFVVAKGFTVSDGTNQYVVQDGGIIGVSGSSAPLFALATTSGTWNVPAGSVNQIVTSLPPGVSLTVTNPNTGTPGAGDETQEDYALRVQQANLAASQGMARYLKTLLGNVAGVQTRLISVQQQTGGGWKVICGGGDPYQAAYAIYTALFDISTLVGSVISVTGITKANPAVYTTNLNHGLVNGEIVTVSDASPAIYDVAGTAYTATVISETEFSLPINSSAFTAAYVGSGVLSPNNRNISVTVYDYPDTYLIPIVDPPQQTVTMVVTWNTTSSNLVSPAAVSQLAAPALAAYVNGIAVGFPMNLYELQATFQTAVASILPAQLLTRMVFDISINGVGVSPESGTGIIAGDPESYFTCSSTGVIINQG